MINHKYIYFIIIIIKNRGGHSYGVTCVFTFKRIEQIKGIKSSRRMPPRAVATAATLFDLDGA